MTWRWKLSLRTPPLQNNRVGMRYRVVDTCLTKSCIMHNKNVYVFYSKYINNNRGTKVIVPWKTLSLRHWPLKDKNELSKTFSQGFSITQYHPSTIFRADTIFCSSQEEFEDTKGAIHHDLVNRFEIYVSQITTICSTCRKHFPVLSSFTTYYRICN
jgi:hypothetical protein